MPRRARSFARVLALAALLVLAAGCSKDGGSAISSGPSTTNASSRSSPTGNPVSSTTTGVTSTTAGVTNTTAAPARSTVPSPATTGRPVTTAPALGLSMLAEGDPGSIAAALATSEAAIRDPATPAGDLERHGRSQQVAYRQLAARPEWLPDVLAQVPASLGATVRANAGAGTELRALTKPQPALPPWRIVAPAPAEELLGYYKAAEASVGVPWNYLAAIHLVETRMGRIRGTSTAGAQGPMQFLPSTWNQYGAGGDINSNRDAIQAAARLLARNGAPANMAAALLSYNRSQRYVNAVTAYAEQMGADERAYLGYYHWQVYYRLPDGDRLLPVGYGG